MIPSLEMSLTRQWTEDRAVVCLNVLDYYFVHFFLAAMLAPVLFLMLRSIKCLK